MNLYEILDPENQVIFSSSQREEVKSFLHKLFKNTPSLEFVNYQLKINGHSSSKTSFLTTK